VAPLSDVAFPPAGIRFIDCTGAAAGAGAFVLGAAFEEAGCAHTGAEIANAATAVTPIKRYFMVSSLSISVSGIEDILN